MKQPSKTIPALFVSPAGALGQGGRTRGGVQICTSEYLEVLKGCGFDLSIIPARMGGNLWHRIRRKLAPVPYELALASGLVDGVVRKVESSESRFVFLNLVDSAPLAKLLRHKLASRVSIVLLSHGAHSADELHNIRFRSRDGQGVRATGRELRRLGGQLVCESEQRQHIDHVFCLSESDLALERWLGARGATYLPRVIARQAAVAWQPQIGRLGYVGTLDHPPNADGLNLLLESLAKRKHANVVLRVIGGPEAIGDQLSRTFPFVQYLGQLDDEALRAEAATWCCAIHPLFCYARGCSTKLGVLLGWRIPVITTPQGRRGYSWKEGSLPQLDTPERMADFVLSMDSPSAASALRDEVARVADSSPSIDDVVPIVRRALGIEAGVV